MLTQMALISLSVCTKGCITCINTAITITFSWTLYATDEDQLDLMGQSRSPPYFVLKIGAEAYL